MGYPEAPQRLCTYSGVKAPKLYMQADGHWGRSLGGAGAVSGEVAKYIFCPMKRCQSVWQCRIHTPGLSACKQFVASERSLWKGEPL